MCAPRKVIFFGVLAHYGACKRLQAPRNPLKHTPYFMKPFAFLLLSALPLVAQDVSKTESAVLKMDPTVTRELIAQWVKTERLVSEEKNAWQVEKKQMQELLDLNQKELKLLDEEILKAGASAKTVDERKETYEKELKEYRASQRMLIETLSALLPRVRDLISRLPQPVRETIAADAKRLVSPSAMSEPREVLKSMIFIMTTAGKFNRTVTVVEETRVLSDEKKMTVDVVYLGLARAYYASGSGDTAGVGVPSKDGWVWQSRPELASDIRQAIAVYRKDRQPQLIRLPVSVNDESSEK
jgi:hypothetical protein